MADATTARSDSASRDEELRPAGLTTPIIEAATLIGQVDSLYSSADAANTKRRFKVAALSAVHSKSYDALCEGQYGLLHLLPAGDDRDLMILAGCASMLADQLPDFIAESDTHAAKVCEGIKAACRTISATLAQQWFAGPETVAPLYPELAANIRQDVLLTAALREDAEDR